MKHLFIISVLIFFSCTKETYREDKANQLSKKAKKSQNFLEKQAHVLTSENIENRDKNVKKATKENAKLQKELNTANAKTSKATKKSKYSGEFNIY
jgi:hypothetical protein